MDLRILAAGELPFLDSDQGEFALGSRWFPILDVTTWSDKTTLRIDTEAGPETLTFPDAEEIMVRNVRELDRRPIEAFGGGRK